MQLSNKACKLEQPLSHSTCTPGLLLLSVDGGLGCFLYLILDLRMER